MIIAAVVLFLPILLGSGTFSLLVTLALGWSSFLQRTVPRLTWNWVLIGMALVSIAIILFLAHKFLNGLTKSIAAKRGTTWNWPWKWTWSLLVALMLLFLVGMAVGGTAHQIGWIAASPEPLNEKKSFRFEALNEMKQLELAFRIAIDDADGNLANARSELWDPKNDYFGSPQAAGRMLQRYHLLAVVDENGIVLGAIVFPRNAETRERSGGVCSLEEENDSNPRSKKISELLHKYQARLVAL